MFGLETQLYSLGSGIQNGVWCFHFNQISSIQCKDLFTTKKDWKDGLQPVFDQSRLDIDCIQAYFIMIYGCIWSFCTLIAVLFSMYVRYWQGFFEIGKRTDRSTQFFILNPYIFVTYHCQHLIFQTLISISSQTAKGRRSNSQRTTVKQPKVKQSNSQTAKGRQHQDAKLWSFQNQDIQFLWRKKF